MSDKYKLPDGRERFLAHDVRHLGVCDGCGEIGDNRTMIQCVLGYYHGECAVQALGENSILSLPWKEREKLTLADVGVDLMRKLIEIH